MIILIFILLAIITLLIMYIVMDKMQRNANSTIKKTDNNCDVNSEKIQMTNLQKLIGIKSIKNNLVTSTNDDIGCVINISTPDFQILSDTDQNIYENKLIDLIYKLKYDIKVITIVRNVNMHNTIEHLINKRENMENEYLYDYSINLQQSLVKEEERKVFQKYYCIYSRVKGNYEDKLKDLKYKTHNFIQSLETSGSKASILSTIELIELLNTMLKKYDKIDVQAIEESGAFEITS